MSSSNASKGAKSFSMPCAESARARARELLGRWIARTEGEFASAMRAHDARAMGIAHRPDGPRAIASMRSLGIRDENWDEADEEDTLSPRASSSTPSTRPQSKAYHTINFMQVRPTPAPPARPYT